MKNWWCVDIESIGGAEFKAKSKDKMTLKESIAWLSGYGECDKDYFIICALEIFYKKENGKDIHEGIVKTEMLRTLVKANA